MSLKYEPALEPLQTWRRTQRQRRSRRGPGSSRAAYPPRAGTGTCVGHRVKHTLQCVQDTFPTPRLVCPTHHPVCTYHLHVCPTHLLVSNTAGEGLVAVAPRAHPVQVPVPVLDTRRCVGHGLEMCWAHWEVCQKHQKKGAHPVQVPVPVFDRVLDTQ